VVGSWRKLHNEELHDLYAFPYVIKVNESKSMIWTEQVRVACMGNMKMHTKCWSENLNRRDHLEDIGRRVILEWILRK